MAAPGFHHTEKRAVDGAAIAFSMLVLHPNTQVRPDEQVCAVCGSLA